MSDITQHVAETTIPECSNPPRHILADSHHVVSDHAQHKLLHVPIGCISLQTLHLSQDINHAHLRLLHLCCTCQDMQALLLKCGSEVSVRHKQIRTTLPPRGKSDAEPPSLTQG